MFRFISFLICLSSYLNKISSQCLNDAISAAFTFECISGDPTGAWLGLDSVVYVVPNSGSFLGVAGTLVEIFKNGVPHPSGSFLPGDEVKIKPLAIGAGNISWVCNQNGCATGGAVSFNICSAPMPILFQNQPIAKVHNNKTQITWSVASQLNNEKYIIEHSNPDSYREALNFSSIGEIAGDGTSNETKHYEYIHTSTSIGINYYRIKQVDYDGKYSYSDIASVQYSDNGETNIYPNPAISEVNIITTAPTLLQIMDVYGRVHSKQEISEGQNTINLSALPTGIYHVGINNQRIKLIKL